MKATILIIMTFTIGCNGYRGFERKETGQKEKQTETRTVRSESPKIQRRVAAPQQKPVPAPEKKPAPKIIEPDETVVEPDPKVDMTSWKKETEGENTFLCTDIIADRDTVVVFTLKFTQDSKDLYTKVFPVELKKSAPQKVRIPYTEPGGKWQMNATLEFKKLPKDPVAAGK